MKTEDLKTGFWGYKKFSVYQYITQLEEEFSAKLLEKDQESRAILEQERQRVQQLEAEVQALRQQNEAQMREQSLISNTLLEAQRYAEQLRSQAEQREAQLQQQLEEAYRRQEAELDGYSERLGRLREEFCALLQEMDRSAQQLQTEVEQAKEEAPARNMSLFHRKPEPVV